MHWNIVAVLNAKNNSCYRFGVPDLTFGRLTPEGVQSGAIFSQ